jgi:hypothetical protein
MPILEIVAALTGILTFIFLVNRFVTPAIKRVSRYLDWQDEFKKDWQGEPARAGRDATLGVMERLNRLDGELSRNGGDSVKDVVETMQKDVCSVNKRLTKLEKAQENLNNVILERLS